MARIRSIKPTFWTSEQVMECSHSARLLFIGMWNFADDYGNIPGKVRELKVKIFPGDDILAKDILGLLNELSRNGLILAYRVDDEDYINITGWHHQRIDKRQKAQHPAPDKSVVDHSQTTLGLLPPDRIGEERKGGEKKESKKDSTPPPLSTIPAPAKNGEPVTTDQPSVGEGDGKRVNLEEIRLKLVEIIGVDDAKEANFMTVNQIRIWVSDGCDPELDIIGTIEDVMVKRRAQGQEGPPGSFAYFTKSVQRAKASRLATPTEAEGGPPAAGWSQAHKDRMQAIARLKGFLKTGVALQGVDTKLTLEQNTERLAALEAEHARLSKPKTGG